MDKIDKWNKRFLALCNHIAEWSEDKDHKVGAVIVGHNLEVLSTGYNGFPRGVDGHIVERENRENGEKFFWVEHAERNAIYNAVRNGIALANTTIYVNRYPCSDCARAIIQSGISNLIVPPKPKNDGALDHSFDVSETMLVEAGLNLITYDTYN